MASSTKSGFHYLSQAATLPYGGPPLPESNLDKYRSKARLQESLNYAEQAVAFDLAHGCLSPITRLVIHEYRKSCKAAFASKGNDDDALESVQYFEQKFREDPSAIVPRPDIPRDNENEISDGMRIWILLRYGDYVARFWEETKKGLKDKNIVWPQSIRNKLVRNVAKELDSLSEKFQPLYTQLQRESPQWDHGGTSRGFEGVETSFTLWQISKKHGVQYEYLVSMVNMYAERNERCHSKLQEHLALGQVVLLGRMLYNDWRWARLNWPVNRRDEQLMICYWLETTMYNWFGVEPDEDNAPGDQWYVATDALEDLILAARLKGNTERKNKGEDIARAKLDKQIKQGAQAAAEALLECKPFDKWLFSRAIHGYKDEKELNPNEIPAEYKAAMLSDPRYEPAAGGKGKGKAVDNTGATPVNAGPPSPSKLKRMASAMSLKGEKKKDIWDRIMLKRKKTLKPVMDNYIKNAKQVIGIQIQIERETVRLYEETGLLDPHFYDPSDESKSASGPSQQANTPTVSSNQSSSNTPTRSKFQEFVPGPSRIPRPTRNVASPAQSTIPSGPSVQRSNPQQLSHRPKPPPTNQGPPWR